MPLSKKKQEKIMSWFKQHSNQKAPPSCPVCQHRDWDVYNSLYALKEVEEKEGKLHAKNAELPGGQKAKVLIAVSCKNCGRITLFDAKQIGII